MDKTKQIKVGFSGRGTGVVYANLENGALSQAFKDTLLEGLQTRAKAIVYTNSANGIQGINSRNSFTDAIYVPGKGWKHEKYHDYNEYVKSFCKTTVYGRNQLPNKKYVYVANPVVPITIPKNLGPVFTVKENSSTQSVTTSQVDENQIGSANFQDLFNMSIKPGSLGTITEVGTAPENSRPITMETLKEIYNFTPEEQRNGKTVAEVYRDLQQHGHTYISKGFNPFSRCF